VDTIIGLGNAGCNIADKFAKYPQYEVYKIDIDLEATPHTHPLKSYEKMEDYEEKCPLLGKFFKDVSGEILFVVGGGGKVSSSSLTILKNLKHCEINVLFIKPDMSFLGPEATLLANMTFGVFQEYARSGVFKKLYLIDNSILENILAEVSIKNYYDDLNEAIVSTFHMINFYNHNKSITDTFSNVPAATRIATIGVVDPEKNKDKMFFSLDNPTDVVYYYAYNQGRLEESGNLFSKIKNSLKKKSPNDVRVTYGIFETDYKEDYIYCVKHTSVIQEQNKIGRLED